MEAGHDMSERMIREQGELAARMGALEKWLKDHTSRVDRFVEEQRLVNARIEKHLIERDAAQAMRSRRWRTFAILAPIGGGALAVIDWLARHLNLFGR